MTSTDHRTTTTHLLVPDDTDVRFTTTHLLGLGRVAGTVRLLEGTVVLDPSGTELIGVEATLDLTTFESGSRARDRAVASARVLDTAAHPRATFRSTSVRRTEGGFLVRGQLAARGTTGPVDLHVTDPAAGGPVRATAVVDRSPYEIPLPAAMAGRTLAVEITVAVPQGPQAPSDPSPRAR